MKSFKNIFLLASIALSMVIGYAVSSIVSAASGAPIEGVFTVLAVGSLALHFGFRETGILASAFDISALNTALGAYFRKGKDGLFSEMLMGMGIEDRMEIWDDCKDEVILPNLGIDDLVKPANDTTFSGSSSSLNFGARTLKVRKWKVDLLLVPGALEKSWLGAYKQKGSDAYDMPFEQYIMNYIGKKVQENIRMKALYAGVYNSGGTAPADIMDGLLTLIAAEITATNITPVATGAVSLATIIDDAEATYDALGEAYKAVETQMLLSPTLFDWYVRKYRSTYGVNMDYTGMAMGKVRLDGTLCTIVREPGFGSSQRIVVTPKSNIVYGVDLIGEENNIKSQEFERSIKLMIDAKSGIQLKEIHARALAVNDQA
jgi:hypothetical protein